MRETDTDTDTESMQQSKCAGHDHFWCRECGSFANADCRAATCCCMQQIIWVFCFSNLGAVNIHREKERVSCLELTLCHLCCDLQTVFLDLF